MKIQSIYTSTLAKRGLEFACDNSALFAATTAFALSVVARPLAIAITPKTEKENKKYAIAKSLSSSLAGYLLMLCASKPIASAVKKIDSNPSKYLKDSTIQALKGNNKTLLESKEYNFATQAIKLGLGFFIAAPKSILTSNLIPPFVNKIFPQKKDNNKKEIAFKGSKNELLTNTLAKIIDSNSLINASKKLSNTHFEHHMMNLTDVLSTSVFIFQTKKNKKIETNRKTALIYNSIISTGLSIIGGYAINKSLDKPIKKFIDKFRIINKDDPNLHKYLKGFNVARPALLLGIIYYILIPLISTFTSDKFAKIKDAKPQKNQ